MKFLSTLSIALGLSTVSVLANPSHLNRMDDSDGRVDIQARNPAAMAALEIIPLVIDIGKEIAGGIMGAINDDKEARSEFTQRLVSETRQKFPDRNVVVCHTKHHYKWDGVQGQDWSHQHQEFDIQLGGTIGYEIYITKGGEFFREGDGGYLNVSGFHLEI
jgi:hypothetical protein